MKLTKYKLGEILELQRGYDLPSSQMKVGNILVAGSNGVIGYHNEARSNHPCITVGRSGSVGKVHYYEQATWAHNTALFVKDFKGNNPQYLYYFLKNLHLDKMFVKGSSVVPSLDRKVVHSLIVPFHRDIACQKSISSILSNIDRKIELNRAINQNLEAMAKQLYDYWFVQFDFPNEEGEPYKLSGGKMVWNEKLKREIPEGWNVMSINEICTSCRGVSYGKDDLLSNGSGVLVLRGNNIDNNHIVYDSNVAFVPYNFVSKEQHIKAGDIIMTMSSGSKAHVGKCAMFHKDSEHTFGAFLSKFTPKKELRYMTFLFLTSGYFKSLITAFCNGTGINNLTNQIFDDVLLVLPDEKKTRLFESKVSGLFAMIGNNEENMRILTKQRDELLPLLMNGQVSVNSDLSASGEKERKNLLLNQKHFLHI